MWNVKFNHKTFFYILITQTKINEQTEHNKTVVKIHESLGCETAIHVNFMQHMLVLYSSCYFSSLEGDIAEVSKILTSGN